jgi:plastocyanin
MAQINVDITSKSFPADTPVSQGDTVVWTNKMSMQHTVTADDFSFDSGQLGKDASFSQVFDTPGAVPYHCENHPDEMTGTVTVKAAGGSGDKGKPGGGSGDKGK